MCDEMRWDRAWGLMLGVLIAVLLAWLLYQSGPTASWLPGCLFHRWTGFDCPGCGMTRAAHAALHGRLGEALRFNPLGMVLLPAAMVGLGLEWIGWVRGRPLPVRFRIGGYWAWWLLAVLLTFWVLRNVPVWPCTLLAPP
jgi:hypothetical protein